MTAHPEHPWLLTDVDTRSSPKSSTSSLHRTVIVAEETPLVDIQGDTPALGPFCSAVCCSGGWDLAWWEGVLNWERKGYLCWTRGPLLSAVPELMIRFIQNRWLHRHCRLEVTQRWRKGFQSDYSVSPGCFEVHDEVLKPERASDHTIHLVNTLSSSELYALKCLTPCYISFTSFK